MLKSLPITINKLIK